MSFLFGIGDYAESMDMKTAALTLLLGLSACGGSDPDCVIPEYTGPTKTEARDVPACWRALADYFECHEPKDGERTRCCLPEHEAMGWECSGTE